MSQIEVFNTQLNESNKDVKQRSRRYQEQVMSCVSNRLHLLKNNDRACIIGTGSMSDIDITLFSGFFNEVLLTDIDLSSVKAGLKKQNIEYYQRRRLQMIRTEYTGFEVHHFFDDFKERIINCHSYEKIDQVLQNKLKNLDDYRFLKEYSNRIDFLFVSPIYTQLIYNQALRACSELRSSGYPEHFIKYIENYLLQEMIPVINRFNHNLINVLHEDGEMFVLSDIFQLDNQSDFYKRVKHAIHSAEVMDEIYQGYKQKYGMGLGDYGLYNLDEQLQSKMEKWFIWPFSEQSSFIVKLKIYRKRT